MTPPRLRDDLQRALGQTYSIERELGGGGMSHVFLATETSLGRQVVIKTLATELLEGMSADRFAREVQVAARLQQANIVPVLSAGDANGVPYYTMPFVLGESAVFYAHRLLTLSNSVGRIGIAARVLAVTGQTAEARSLTRRLESMPSGTWMRNTALVLAYSGLGDTTNALAAMERAAAGDGELIPVYAWPWAYALPTGPRADAVWRRYNLDPAKFAKPIARR